VTRRVKVQHNSFSSGICFFIFSKSFVWNASSLDVASKFAMSPTNPSQSSSSTCFIKASIGLAKLKKREKRGEREGRISMLKVKFYIEKITLEIIRKHFTLTSFASRESENPGNCSSYLLIAFCAFCESTHM